ncbi:autotransporter outer membrane beta-barrel domain-containing protein [Helicobacter sp. 23-1044]
MLGGGNAYNPIKCKFFAFISTILLFTTNLYSATLSTYKLDTYELDTICASSTDCKIDKSNYEKVGYIHFGNKSLELNKLTFEGVTILAMTNEGAIDIKDSISVSALISQLYNRGSISTANGITLNPQTISGQTIGGGIGNLYNYGTISASNGVAITIKDKAHLTNLINHGTINGYINAESGAILGNIDNYGTMNGIVLSANPNYTHNLTNYGTINRVNGQFYHLGGGGTFTIHDYAMKITENAETFNKYNGANTGDNSHLVVEKGTKLQFYNNDGLARGFGKLILELDGDFEYDTPYSLDKLVVDTDGANALKVDLSRLELLNKDIFTLMQQGDSFIVSIGGSNTPITATSKANVATMNNLFLASGAIMSSSRNSARYAKKMANRSNARNAFYAKSHKSITLNSLKENENFFYDSQILIADARDKTIDLAQNSTNLNANQSADSAKESDKYSFLFTPFINHTLFYKSGNYEVSGVDGGFVTAFSGKLNDSNTLGTHFALGYGTLSDKNDKDFKSTNLNFMLGLNYRLDLIYAMFLKARGDFYYFLNEIDSSSITKTKSNNLGFGVSVAYGKDFDFDKWGVLGIEGAIDYKALNTGKVSDSSVGYNSALYHLLYLDLGLNYYKYFNTDLGLWGVDAGLGIRGNLTPKATNGTLMVGNRAVDITLDNDNFLAYLNVGGSYVWQAQRFDMEFTLRYNGSFGDKSISNGGSFEWRVKW